MILYPVLPLQLVKYCCVYDTVVCKHTACFDDLGCDDKLGCQISPKNCDDLNACTDDSCDTTADACVNKDVTCTAPDMCTVVSCDKSKGCVSAPKNCDDGINCTRDSCDLATGCVHTPVDSLCNDNNQCTNETCSLTLDCVYTDVVCPTPPPCQISVCRPTFGCEFGQVLCVLNATNDPVRALDTSLDDTLTAAEKAAQQKAFNDQQATYDQQRKKNSDCSYAVCSNSTCEKKQLACALDLTTVTVVSTVLAAGAIAGIVIGIVLCLAGAGGGAWAIAQYGGLGGEASIHASPLYQPAGNVHENRLADPTLG